MGSDERDAILEMAAQGIGCLCGLTVDCDHKPVIHMAREQIRSMKSGGAVEPEKQTCDVCGGSGRVGKADILARHTSRPCNKCGGGE